MDSTNTSVSGQDSQTLEEIRTFFQKVYGWMFAGLVLSGLTAYYVSSSPVLVETILLNSVVFYGLLIGELLLVIGLSWLVSRISANLAVLMFLLYCFATGLTLSVIFLAFTIESIGQVFMVTAGMFGLMSIYGYTTKKDLTGVGQIMIMGLIGIIIASLINLFAGNEMVDYVVSIIGVVVFTGLTAYDVQRIKNTNVLGNEGTDEDRKEAIMGALTLYLDFINLFLKLLRLFGKRR